MDLKSRIIIYFDVFFRPFSAMKMLWNHRRTVVYLFKKKKYKQLYNFIFVIFFVRGEDCGKGVLDPVWKFLPNIAPVPWDIEVEITTRCYLKCVMCEHTYWKDKSYLNQDLSLEQFKDIVNSMPKLKWINMTGEGSSFLNPDFMEMIRFVKSKSIYLDFSHDFLFMTDEIARELIDLGVERIYLSIDAATKETYEKVRVGSDFDKVTNNIKRFIQLKKEMNSPIPEMCFRMTFFNENIHEVEQLIDLIHSFGDVKDMGDEPSVNIVGLLEFEETKGWVEEIPQDVIDRTDQKAKKYGLTIYWSHPSHDECQKPPLHYCTFWTEPYVMMRGYVLPCCGVLMSNKRPFLEKYALGNINEKSLKDIWKSEKFAEFRKLVVDPKGKVPILCAGCRTFNSSDRINKYGVARET